MYGLAILVTAFVFTGAILLLVGVSPWDAFSNLSAGAFGSFSRFAHVVKAWIPLTLCSCGLLFTFRIGLWNIGVEGQVMMGAVFATFVLRMGTQTLYPGMFLFLAFVSAFLGGGLWALIAGILKTKGGVNEIFAGLGMNFVAQGLVLFLIFGPWKRPGVASMSGTELFPGDLWLSDFPFIRISPEGLFLTLFCILFTWGILHYTKIGLNLKAVGKNPEASHLFGLKPGRLMLLAMGAAGGFAGFAGCIQVTGVYHRLIPAISSNYGYLALLVVMLSGYDIRLCIFAAFFFAALNVGSIQLPMVLRIDSSLSGVIQGALVLSALFVHGVHTRMAWKRKTGIKEN